MTLTVVTVATGDYWCGASALINSLADVGFSGEIVVAHDGEPPWILEKSAGISTVRLPSDSRMRSYNLKAHAIGCASKGAPSSRVLYIDADCIVLSADFVTRIDEFLDQAPVYSAEGILPRSDVRHVKWTSVVKELRLAGAGGVSTNLLECVAYVNSGMIAFDLPRDQKIIDGWQSVMDHVLIKEGGFFQTPYFFLPDQDCLNAVIANIDHPAVTMGPLDIWYRSLPLHPFNFIGAAEGPLLLHCTGYSKPWKLDRPPPNAPDIYDRAYYKYRYVECPLVKSPDEPSAELKDWFNDGRRSRIKRRLRRGSDQFDRIRRFMSRT